MRLRLAYTLGNREGNTTRDERILNGIVESQGGRRREDKARVIKRPALVSSYSLAAGQGGATTGQGLFVMITPGAPGIANSVRLMGIRGDIVTENVT